MASYLYRCPRSHETTRHAPMGEAPESADCRCGRSARRVFTPPMLATTAPQLARAEERARASAERPEVTGQVPPARGGPRPPADPRHALLPRP